MQPEGHVQNQIYLTKVILIRTLEPTAAALEGRVCHITSQQSVQPSEIVITLTSDATVMEETFKKVISTST